VNSILGLGTPKKDEKNGKWSELEKSPAPLKKGCFPSHEYTIINTVFKTNIRSFSLSPSLFAEYNT
jgi:hypothetical protein